MIIKVLIVDDEPRAHKIMEAYIARIPELQLSGDFTDALTARTYMQQNDVDLVLLDITMPEVNGFDLIRLLRHPPLIIFTTAHPEFAFESYDYDAVDYLKKPITFERFAKSISKVISLITLKKKTIGLPDHVQLKIDGKDCVIPFRTIHYFQSMGNYIKIITDELCC